MNIISDNEKTHFNRLRTLHSQLIRAKSHLYFFENCLKIYPENLNVTDHFQVAFSTPKFKKAYSDLNKNTRNEKMNLCISHYKLLSGKTREDIGEQKVSLTRFSTEQRLKILTEELTIFSNQLSKRLSKRKELKLKKLLKEIPISPPEFAHINNTWIENLDLTANDKEIILSNQDLHDGIIGAAINLIQRQFPILVIQSPSLYFAYGFEYCPYETIKIIHNNALHWILLSSFNGEVRIFDSLNTDPTIETLQQIKQLFSPDNTFPQYQPSPCHKQVGTTDCGVFAIAYSIDILFGNNPSEIVYDQSKLRQHLVLVHRQPKILMIQSYSTYQENNFCHLKNQFWKRA